MVRISLAGRAGFDGVSRQPALRRLHTLFSNNLNNSTLLLRLLVHLYEPCISGGFPKQDRQIRNAQANICSSCYCLQIVLVDRGLKVDETRI